MVLKAGAKLTNQVTLPDELKTALKPPEKAPKASRNEKLVKKLKTDAVEMKDWVEE